MQHLQEQLMNFWITPAAAAMQLCKWISPLGHLHYNFWEEICPLKDPRWSYQTHKEKQATCP